MANTPQTVDQYLEQFEGEKLARLTTVRSVIRAAAPEATERISWGMPTYDYRGVLIHFAAHAKHIGLYPGATGVEAFAPRLADFKVSKGAIQMPDSRPLPLALIEEIVRFRAAENEREQQRKKAQKAAKQKGAPQE